MADGEGEGEGDGAQPPAAPGAGHWLQSMAPNFRHQVVNAMVGELSSGLEGSPSPCLRRAVAKFENQMARESSSMEEYLSAIIRKMAILKLRLQQTRAGDYRAATAAATPPPVFSQPQMHMYTGVEQPMAQLMHMYTGVEQPMAQAGNLAGSTAVRPNAQPNHPLWQNAAGMCVQQQQQQPYPYPHQQPVIMNQQGLSVNQHQWQGYHGNPRAPATMGGGGEVDWREDMFRKITYLKDSYLPELADFDRAIAFHPKTKEQLESLSKEESQRYMAEAKLKQRVMNTLWILQLQKGDLDESIRELFGKYHKYVLDLVQTLRTMRALSLIVSTNVAAAARSSSEFMSYGGVTDTAAAGGGGGMAPYAGGGTNRQQMQHEQAQTSDMGVNLKRVFRHEPERPWDRSVDEEWERSGYYKRSRKAHYGVSVLDDEIRAASAMLVDTAIFATGGGDEAGSTEIEFVYSSVALTPRLRQAVNASEISARLLVPGDYPRSSPVLLGNDDETRRKKKGVPVEVDATFRRALNTLPEPMSVDRMAMTWDACVRNAVVEFAHKLGDGSFSSPYSRWVDVKHEED